MKRYVKEFCRRGLMAAWAGPVICAIVWFALYKANVITALSVPEVLLGVCSTALMAFIAAGVSVVYLIENLPKAFAGLIQMAALYADYLGFYLLNGWITPNHIWLYSLIFIAGFTVIWFGIYIPIRMKVNKMNRILSEK